MLAIRNLVTEFALPEGTGRAVDRVSFDVHAGETVGVVGESGSGKTVTVLSALGLLPQPPARVLAGEVIFNGDDLLKMRRAQLRDLLGREIGLVFQDPMTSLNPTFTVGNQIAEALRVHQTELSRSGARRRAIELLQSVGVPDPAARVRQYPSEFSGGMRQRAMIAIAIANDPLLIIADEPTTALDVTVQAQVLDLLVRTQQERSSAMMLITHDLGVIAETADRVVVMYAGRVVEIADVFTLFRRPRHPYTVGLLDSQPSIELEADRLRSIPGSAPHLLDRVQGCPFRSRCVVGRDRQRCADEEPLARPVGDGHWAACHYPDESALAPANTPGEEAK